MKTLVALFLIIFSFDILAHKIKFATVAPEGTPWSDLLEEISKEVKTKSGGKLQIKTYMGGQLGGEEEILQKLKRGNIQGAGLTSAALSTVIPEMDVIELPYLFDSYEEVDYVLDKKLFPLFQKIFTEKGMVLVAWSENGFRSLGHKTKILKTPASLKGEKMRSQVSEVHLSFYKGLEAAPQAMPITEVLGALQTGLIQGFDNTILYAMAAEWHTAIKHFTLTKHIYQPGAVVYSQKLWEKLTPQEQTILIGKGNDLAAPSRKAIRSMDLELQSSLKETGVSVHELSEKELAEFKKILRATHQSVIKKIGAKAQEVYDVIMEGKKEFAETKKL